MSQKEFTERLAKLPDMARYSDANWAEHEALAQSIEEFAELGEKISLMCKEMQTETNLARLADMLHGLREEIRHVVYHVFDSKYLRLVAESAMATVDASNEETT